ncbi:toxin CptA [Marinobacter gudaonensis]|uniref:Toxin CptA n=1 Tax=Marinobacter gudaonensis TaxID=375760 RepID=A0A1I6HMV5_9GAMM|nr:hypothetical protein [Marinobacter gudaonensis]SFR55772.1 toxin CptA [Marinobacter gudaonensis]
MSSRIELSLSPSRLAGVIAGLPWLVLLVFLLIGSLKGKPWLLTAVPIVLAGAVLQYRCSGALLTKRSVTGLLVDQGQLYVVTGDHRRIPVRPAPSSRLWSRLALLKLRPVGTRFQAYSAVIVSSGPGCPGNAPEADFRRLRMWLRLGTQGPASN